MRITIVGGGNIGTQFAVHCAEKCHDVIVYTSAPDLYDGCLNIVDENGITTHQGIIHQATNDPKIAFSNAEVIIITFPAMMMNDIANLIFEFADKNSIIGVVPGNGGSECAFKKCIERGNVFFGIERVPAIARLISKGKTVKSTGYRNELHVASIPKSEVDKCCKLVQDIFEIPCLPIPNYLNLTLTPSNPILHTTRLRTIFKDYYKGKVYSSLPLFYEEWDDESSKLLFACDNEVQMLCQVFPEFQLEYVKSLREHYESPTIESMTKKISSIQAFKGLKTPAVSVEGGFVPDFHSRYFTADFSYGLTIIKQIADLSEVETPCIDSVLTWYKKIAVEKNEFRFLDYGISSLSDIKQFYLNKG
ncbi:NAD/NADP-dependent octopine/nopaline dehydrogenase family protein [Ruminococcus sp. HUN007]|uniref:NAD/NADP-dependent octopine/nopaline dehydrogenase family protein n=1 Tax=Ruminococcus sp. HUN007 TaxID=1514668 RepID=UPI0009DFB5F5|nr:NAD/NADP-dependent octopine/nopaline dehydrogenase family protein [Ruminococcus sp. HUN007]